ncbi:hypothetical protein BDW72DRAFT_209501 [Aspergillus terricola var. indicus]
MSQATPDPLPDHISHNYVIFISVASVMTLISTVIVALRILTRVLTISAKWDDWAILGALVFAYGFLTTTVLVATVAHAGYQITQYDMATLGKWSQIALANNVLYNCSITLSKLSVLLLYRRLFAVSKPLRTATWIVGAIAVASYIAAVFGLVFATDPVHAQWQPWVPHRSIHNEAFWIAMGAINAALDFTIFCMPQPIVWRLHQTRQRKVLVSLVFALGGFVCIASIVRLYYMATIDVNNATYTMSTPGIWTMIEMEVTIICACLPIVPSMLKYYQQRQTRCSDNSAVKDESSKRSASSRAYLLGLSSGSSRIGGTGTGAGLSKIPPSSTWSARQGLYADTITDIEHETGLAAAEQYRLENVRAVHVKTSLDVSYGGVS